MSSERSRKDQLSRKPKQDFDFVAKLLDVLEETPAFSENLLESGERVEAEDEEELHEEVQEEVRSNKNGVPSSEGKCEETNPSARLRVCLPRLEAGGSQLYLTGQETFSETFCYNR